MITGCRKLCEQMNELEVKVEMVTTFFVVHADNTIPKSLFDFQQRSRCAFQCAGIVFRGKTNLF